MAEQHIVRQGNTPPAGPAGEVQQFVGEVMSAVTAPVDALNLAVAKATLAVLNFCRKCLPHVSTPISFSNSDTAIRIRRRSVFRFRAPDRFSLRAV